MVFVIGIKSHFLYVPQRTVFVVRSKNSESIMEVKGAWFKRLQRSPIKEKSEKTK